MANPKVAMKTELEEKYRRKYEEKLKEAKKRICPSVGRSTRKLSKNASDGYATVPRCRIDGD